MRWFCRRIDIELYRPSALCPQTPQTPKETAPSAASAPSASKPFFRTPAPAVGGAVAAARKRGSAQRRLDVGHAPAQPLTG